MTWAWVRQNDLSSEYITLNGTNPDTHSVVRGLHCTPPDVGWKSECSPVHVGWPRQDTDANWQSLTYRWSCQRDFPSYMPWWLVKAGQCLQIKLPASTHCAMQHSSGGMAGKKQPHTSNHGPQCSSRDQHRCPKDKLSGCGLGGSQTGTVRVQAQLHLIRPR